MLTPEEVRRLAHRGEKDGRVSFWLQPRDHDAEEFREKWEGIGSGLSADLVAGDSDTEEAAAADGRRSFGWLFSGRAT